MAMVNNTSDSHFKVKNTMLKHTDGKGNFKSETILMAMVNNTSDSPFKVKNTMLKDTDGKGNFKRMLSFLQVDKGRPFFYRIVLRGIQNT